MKSFFSISADRYVPGKSFHVCRPASLNQPQDNAVMFVTPRYLEQASALIQCENCLVFWPENHNVPEEYAARHAIFPCVNPRKQYCLFFYENGIVYLPPKEEFDIVDGAMIARTAVIGRNCILMPGAYIGGEVIIGDECYIGAGVKLMGQVRIGDRVVIRENSVIGADGLSTNRDDAGKAITMPQFGGVTLENDVQIGALTVIARGAIDHTIIRRGAKIDNSSFISHNVEVGENTFIVGETIMFGSSSTGKNVFVSGNSTIRDGRHVGDCATVGMGSVVVCNVENGTVVKGNPAK